VFDGARCEISGALAEPPDDRRVTNLLVGAESRRRSGGLSDDWRAIFVALVGAPWKPTLPPAARMFVSQRWPCMQRVAAELIYERRVLVSRVAELCNVKFNEFA
jgi:hypothetical protein